MNQEKPVTIVDVWSHNLEFEFSRIKSILHYFPFVCIDSEFPGVVVRPKADSTPPSSQNYKALKDNVDFLQLIQLGITLSDFHGNLPDFGTSCSLIWQFNFKEFDVSRDLHAPDSIELLRKQGIDFERNRKEGVDSTRFSSLLYSSGLIFHNTRWLRWITFHGAYDFAYLLKIITRRPLPENIDGFYDLCNLYFGSNIYDLKYMIKYCIGVFGGLERVANTYGLKRITGNAHCAGSDSLLTCSVFQKMVENKNGPVKGEGVLFGLERQPPIPCIPQSPIPCILQAPLLHPSSGPLLHPSSHPFSGPLLHPSSRILRMPGIQVVICIGRQ